MQETADVLTWGTVVGIVLPYVLALVNQPRWSGTVKRVIAVVAAIVFGALTALIAGNLDNVEPTRTSILAAVASVLVASQAMYARFAAPTAKAIEAATSPDPAKRDA